MNGHSTIKNKMDKFVVIHASGDDGSQWQMEGKNDGYVPRVYFLHSDGTFADVKAPNPSYLHFFPTADSLVDAMDSVLQRQPTEL